MTYNIPAPQGAQSTDHKHELMPPGDHDLEVVFATDKDREGNLLTTRSGDPRIKMKVMNDDQLSFYHFLYLTEKAYKMVWEFLSACGMEPSGDEFVLDPEMLVGRRFRATVYVEDGWNRLRRPCKVPDVEQDTPDVEQDVPDVEQELQDRSSVEDDRVPF